MLKIASVRGAFFWYFLKCTIKKVLFFYDKGAYLQLEKQKTPVYNVCWSVRTPPLRNPHFSSHSTQPHHHPISPLNTNSLQNKPSLLKGIFSLNSLQTKYSLLFTLAIHLLTHLSSSFADENISH